MWKAANASGKTEPQEKDVVKNGCFVTENRIAMATESKVYVADIKSGETLWEKRLSKEFSGYEDGQCVSNGKQLAVCEATWVSVYDAVDGTILLEQELEEAKERGLGRLNAAVINEAGTLLAWGKPEINLRQMITQINSAAFTSCLWKMGMCK